MDSGVQTTRLVFEQPHGNVGTRETQVSSVYGPLEARAALLSPPNGATCERKIHPGRDQIEPEHISCTVHRRGSHPCPRRTQKLATLGSMRQSAEKAFLGSGVQLSQDTS